MELSTKMEAKADQQKVDEFWALYPEFKQNVELFLADYYQIFPHMKPADYTEDNNIVSIPLHLF